MTGIAVNWTRFELGLRTVLVAAGAAFASDPLGAAMDVRIRNHSAWKDSRGELIDCHEGGITFAVELSLFRRRESSILPSG